MSQPGDGGASNPYGSQPNQPYGEPQDPHGQASQGQQPYPSAPPYQQPYGAPSAPYGYPQPTTRSNGLAIAGFVCGLVGILIFNIILGPLALIFGGIGLSRANAGASNKGLAIAAVVLGVVDILLFFVLLAVLSNRGFVY